MSALNSSAWLNILHSACQAPCALHLIIDLTGCEVPVLASVNAIAPPIACHLLFTGLPEDGIKEFGPLLVRVDLDHPVHRHWLEELVLVLGTDSRLLAFGSSWPFAALVENLKASIEARFNGKLGLLRYYDPRLFPLLFDFVLTAEQQRAWLEPMVFWSWLDRDAIPKYMRGVAGVFEASPKYSLIELSDNQLGMLGCVSDASIAANVFRDAFPPGWGKQRRFDICYNALLEASQLGLLGEAARHAHLEHRLGGL